MHEFAFMYDSPKLAEAMQSGVRKYDRDGSLAEAMQGTVRCGNVWYEGIIWPRIAEISLLGALGCGAELVKLAVDRLQRKAATTRRNYDYLVLQATPNSIPFYESLGFVRVGCISDKPESADDPKSFDAVKLSSEYVSSPVEKYTVTNDGKNVRDIAMGLGVNTWDVIFLNHFTFPNVAPSSKVLKGTELFIPSKKAHIDACSNALRNSSDFGGASDATQWYYCTDGETPNDIAKMFNVECRDLIRRNRDRLSGFQPFTNMVEGTKLQVSHFDRHMDTKVPYCHWTLPADAIDTAEPSYMMALELNRKTKHRLGRTVECSSAVPVKHVTFQYGDNSEKDIPTSATGKVGSKHDNLASITAGKTNPDHVEEAKSPKKRYDRQRKASKSIPASEPNSEAQLVDKKSYKKRAGRPCRRATMGPEKQGVQVKLPARRRSRAAHVNGDISKPVHGNRSTEDSPRLAQQQQGAFAGKSPERGTCRAFQTDNGCMNILSGVAAYNGYGPQRVQSGKSSLSSEREENLVDCQQNEELDGEQREKPQKMDHNESDGKAYDWHGGHCTFSANHPFHTFPANHPFHLFLNENRHIIERKIRKEEPYFDMMNEGYEKFYLIAMEGAKMWLRLGKKEQNKYT